MINKVIDLEIFMEIYIASYFCATDIKMSEFKKLMFWDTQMGLGKKVSLVNYIIENYDKDALLMWPDISRDLLEIVEYRNRLAHRVLDISRVSINKAKESNSIIVKHLKNEDPIEITSEKIEYLISKAHIYATFFMITSPPWNFRFPDDKRPPRP